MSIIRQIYELGVCVDLKEKTESELSKEVYEVIGKAVEEKEKEKMGDLFFEASSCGQAKGYEEGFKVAVALMAECFTD